MCLIQFSSKHGIATILRPATYPATVEPNTAFNIIYTIKNTGRYSSTLWAHLTFNGKELTNSRWSQKITVNGTVTKTYHHPGVPTPEAIKIEAGY